ncbi:hypothetical protein BC833DRAFT_576868 [Globomyces pollinis-pini]|nr:hypothetical protein BC833DRAFT_576868 [Globomyces pollinis-pini]
MNFESHQEAARARRESITEAEQEQAELLARSTAEKLERAQLLHQQSIENIRATASEWSSRDLNKSRERLDQEREVLTRESSLVEADRHDHAKLIREETLQKKSAIAHEFNDHVEKVRLHKTVMDAIGSSQATLQSHEEILKDELAAAKKADYLHGIQEKQARLQ